MAPVSPFIPALAVVIIAGLGGCLEGADDAGLVPTGADAQAMLGPGAYAPPAAALPLAAWNGDCTGPCTDGSFDVTVSAGADAQTLQVWLTWDGKQGRGVTFTLVGPIGETTGSTEGYHASRVIIADPAPGRYAIDVEANQTYQGSFFATAWIDTAPMGTVHDLLPNISTLVPTDISYNTPSIPNIEEGPDIPGLGGCLPQERLRDGAQRCLRLSNGLGNNGAGRLHLTLEAAQYVDALTGNARLVQHISQSDGTVRAEEVGLAELHDEHAHFHFAGLQDFTLYEFDVETGIQGEVAVAHTKSGFCIEDRATMDTYEEPAEAGVHSIVFCVAPDPTDDVRLHMGLERGWYDLYFYELPQQYIETSGLSDGTYELVSSNIGEGLIEAHLFDNAASAVIEISGDQVTVLEQHGFYHRSGDERRV